jgi:plastocyanin
MKRSVLLSSALMLLVPFIANAMGVQVIINGKTVVLNDVPQNAWFATYVHDAAEASIVNGYMDANGNYLGRFGPSDNVTVAQALKIAILGAGYDTNAYSSVIDAGVGGHWAAPYVSVAKAEHFAITNGTMQLDRAATRAEVATIFATAFRVPLDASSNAGYKDVNTNSPDAPAIAELTKGNVISGDTDANGTLTGTFRPSDDINRAEVVKIVMLARATYGQPGTGRSPSSYSSQTDGTNIVTYTSTGFSPSVLHVKIGAAVTFKNDTTGSMWVQTTSSDLGSFDEMRGVGQGNTYVFTFNKVGTWGYHNYLHPSDAGTIVVDQ